MKFYANALPSGFEKKRFIPRAIKYYAKKKKKTSEINSRKEILTKKQPYSSQSLTQNHCYVVACDYGNKEKHIESKCRLLNTSVRSVKQTMANDRLKQKLFAVFHFQIKEAKEAVLAKYKALVVRNLIWYEYTVARFYMVAA